MKKVLLGLVVVGIFWWGGYEILNRADVEADRAWSQVESVLQRRYDLIPNLVNTVKGYAKHESSIFEAVAEARASAGKIDISSLSSNPELMEQYQKINSKMTSALSRLLAVAENYPQLKADQNFLALQSQIEGTENRINVERQRYNNAAANVNYYIRNLVLGLIARVHGFKQRAYFKADVEAQKAPEVKF